VGTLLASYAKGLGAEDLGHHHDPQRKSDTILALLSYQGQLTHQKHTDLGSLTVLFSDQWGLQVMSPGEAPRWQWVEPRPHQAVINVGDALRFLSGKRLYSSLHRVVKEGRALADTTKYSVAYLLRAADDTVFDDVEGVKVTASQLAAAKYGSYAADHDEQEKSQVLCGGMETVLGVRG
jgi:isopenicillin N synthase-like dioxygenase